MSEKAYLQFTKDNALDLELEFIATYPPEDIPLDDELPDWMANKNDEFEAYCLKQFAIACEIEGTK